MASASGQAPRLACSETESSVDNKRKDNIHRANIVAARAVADAIRTSLPRLASSKTESYVDNKHKEEIRRTNIVANAIRTPLSPLMASASVQAPRLASSKTEPYVDNKSKEDLRRTNIAAALAVAGAIRTSLGLKGMDKMISTASGEVIITNVGGDDHQSSK